MNKTAKCIVEAYAAIAVGALLGFTAVAYLSPKVLPELHEAPAPQILMADPIRTI
jgi:hypothetical protein